MLTTVTTITTAPSDYSATSEVLTFDQRVDRVCINISITDDEIQEPPSSHST